jgi:ribosomal protein S24E
MKSIQILKEKENLLFKRKEIEATLISEIAPKKEAILKMISEKFSTPEENIKIKKIHGKFGSKVFKLTANIYGSKEDQERTEIKSKKKKKQ